MIGTISVELLGIFKDKFSVMEKYIFFFYYISYKLTIELD